MYNEVKNWPLIICDGHTVDINRLFAVDQISRPFVGDVYYASHDPKNQWYYQSSMGSNEAVIFKSWDTAQNVRSRGTLRVFSIFQAFRAY